jgi:hypothetical protein
LVRRSYLFFIENDKGFFFRRKDQMNILAASSNPRFFKRDAESKHDPAAAGPCLFGGGYRRDHHVNTMAASPGSVGKV